MHFVPSHLRVCEQSSVAFERAGRVLILGTDTQNTTYGYRMPLAHVH